jgi:hypothetical protein
LTPNFVFWQTGEAPQPKTIIAKAGKDAAVTNIDVASPNPQFEAKVDKGPGPGQFRINVQPKETNTAAFTTLTVKTDYPKGSPKTFSIMARVTGPIVPAAAGPAASPPATPEK